MVCQVKHTTFQPTDDQWKCPKCGAGSRDFTILWPADDTEDCDMLHEEDVCVCDACGYEESGKIVAAAIKRKLGLVKCPHCKGTGYIERKKDE